MVRKICFRFKRRTVKELKGEQAISQQRNKQNESGTGTNTNTKTGTNMTKSEALTSDFVDSLWLIDSDQPFSFAQKAGVRDGRRPERGKG